jgi:hypothetical protein
VFWLQKPSILRACVREEDAGGMEAGAPLDPKMPLENGRADERVSRGQASERAVCVCVCVYHCRTYYKAVCGGGRGTVKDMCYEVRRAEACMD